MTDLDANLYSHRLLIFISSSRVYIMFVHSHVRSHVKIGSLNTLSRTKYRIDIPGASCLISLSYRKTA